MKIGIMGTRGIPNRYGGFEQFAEQVAPALVLRGHEVFVYNSLQHPYKEKEWQGVQIIHCKDPEHKWGTIGQFFYDLNCIRDSRRRNFDLLFHFGYSSDSFWWGRWPKQTINLVNMDGLEWKRTKYNFLTRQFLKWAEAWAARHSDGMIADSVPMKDYLFRKYKKEAVYIPYPAEIFENPDSSILSRFDLSPGNYYLLIARMEKENSIEMIIRGWMDAEVSYPILVVGNTGNKYGTWLVKKFVHPDVRFVGGIYEKNVLDNLRFYSAVYFHGHSVGGTNPSLLEAMACGCRIAAHDNIFNKAVLGGDGEYFSGVNDIKEIIKMKIEPAILEGREKANEDKITGIYNKDRIIDGYEFLLFRDQS